MNENYILRMEAEKKRQAKQVADIESRRQAMSRSAIGRLVPERTEEEVMRLIVNGGSESDEREWWAELRRIRYYKKLTI